MRTIMALAMTLAALAIVPAAQAATVPVTSLTGDFGATNSTLRLTPDGVNFGVYPTAESGGSLFYGGANGLTLADLTDLSYTFNYRALHEPPNYSAAPYLRIVTDGPDAHPLIDNDGDGNPANDEMDVILDPSHCATGSPPQNEDVTIQVVGNGVRYDDDGCDGVPPDEQPWADVLTGHGTEHVTGIYITQGFAVGDSMSANVPQMTVNGTTFDFGAPLAGPNGPAGTSGTVTLVTAPTIVNRIIPVAGGASCRGDELRTIHVLRRKGETFLSARANAMWLKGKRLPVHGRAITADLRGKPEANYNVVIHARYMRASGIAHTVRSERHISVVCS